MTTPPPPYENEANGIKHATNAVKNNPDRYAIIDTFTGQVHGYIEPGEKPKAFTETLHTAFQELLNDNYELEITTPNPTTDHPQTTTHIIPPTEETAYMKHVIVNTPLPFVIPKASTATTTYPTKPPD